MIILKSDRQEEEVRASIFEILSHTRLLSMATVKKTVHGPASWINTAYFSYTENLELFILTPPTTIHAKNMTNNPSVAVSVFDSHQDPWKSKRGVQMTGITSFVHGEEIDIALKSWWDRMVRHDFTKFAHSYRETYESKLYKIVIDHVKIFDEPRFGEEVWVEAEVIRK